ncbi:MAG TPA: hypothetical protein VK661_07460 [Planctomycetota bacterium]|nr:hypothetical protein [Planctomycetota bacterium]
MNAKYLIGSFLSGGCWGGVAYLMGIRYPGTAIWAGVAASPVIGLIVGVLMNPTYRWSTWARVVASLLSVYVGATLFGLVVGAYRLFKVSAGGITYDPIFEDMASAWYGTTIYFPALWALACLNHFLLGMVRRPAPEAPL